MLCRPAALLGGPLVNVLFQYARCCILSINKVSLGVPIIIQTVSLTGKCQESRMVLSTLL